MASESPDERAPRYRKILFCTDFSPNADLAFEFALAAATAHRGASLVLLHVIPEPEAQFWKSYVYELENVDEKAKQDIDAQVARYKARVPPGLDFQAAFRVGKDWEHILTFAEEEGVDLIVMGRQGHSAFQKVFFGNVTEKVVRKANCPILVVPAKRT